MLLAFLLSVAWRGLCKLAALLKCSLVRNLNLPRLLSLLFLSVIFSLSLDQFSEISTCSAQIYKVARPTPFFFQLHMHAMYCMGVHERAVCYYYDICM